MTIVECYLKALQKAEENATNGGIKLDQARFVQLFNSEQVRLVRYFMEKKNNDNIRYVQTLLVQSEKLAEKDGGEPNSSLFSLPDNFFAFSNISGVFSLGDCSVSDFTMWEAKNENVHELLADEFNCPSFLYRETFYTIGEDSVRVFKTDFNVDDVYLTYYRYPVNVDIEGYIRPDGTESTNIDPELDDKLVEIILNMIQKQFALNENEYNRYQLDLNNVISNL